MFISNDDEKKKTNGNPVENHEIEHEIEEPSENAEIKKQELQKPDIKGISSELDLSNISPQGQKLIEEQKEFVRTSEIIAGELAEADGAKFNSIAARIDAFTERLNLEILKEVYNLPEQEQSLVLAYFFTTGEKVFSAIKNSEQGEANNWFNVIGNQITSLFDFAENEKLDIVNSKNLLATNMGAWLALVKLISHRAKHVDRVKALEMKKNCEEAIRMMKIHPDRRFGAQVIKNAKVLYNDSKGMEMQNFLEEVILPIAEESNNLLKRYNSLFTKTSEDMRNSILKFMLPAEKTVLLATPVDRIAKAAKVLEPLVFKRMGVTTGEFVMKNLKNDIESFHNSFVKARKIIEIGQRKTDSLDPAMEKLKNIGERINSASAENDLYVQTIKSSLEMNKITVIVTHMLQSTQFNKTFFTNYMSWWKDFELISFNQAGNNLQNIFKS